MRNQDEDEDEDEDDAARHRDWRTRAGDAGANAARIALCRRRPTTATPTTCLAVLYTQTLYNLENTTYSYPYFIHPRSTFVIL